MNADRLSNLLHDVEISGTVTFTGDLIFDGQLRGGDIIGEELVIGPDAVVQGNINVTSLVVYGKIEGEVMVTGRCELKSTASLTGSLVAGRLAVRDGAMLIGGVVVTCDAVPVPFS